MGFWDTMKRGAASGVATHGESVMVGERDLMGAVDPVSVEVNVIAGGGKQIVGMIIRFDLDVGEGIEDGEVVRARGAEGRVLSTTHEGSVWMVVVGPENRWDDGVL